MNVHMYVSMYEYMYISGSMGLTIQTSDKESVLGQTGSVEPLSGLPKDVDRDSKGHINIRILPTMISGTPLILGLGTRMRDPYSYIIPYYTLIYHTTLY